MNIDKVAKALIKNVDDFYNEYSETNIEDYYSEHKAPTYDDMSLDISSYILDLSHDRGKLMDIMNRTSFINDYASLVSEKSKNENMPRHRDFIRACQSMFEAQKLRLIYYDSNAYYCPEWVPRLAKKYFLPQVAQVALSYNVN